jgi:hypothetical protein
MISDPDRPNAPRYGVMLKFHFNACSETVSGIKDFKCASSTGKTFKMEAQGARC